MNYPWGHKRRYNAYAQYFEKTFGKRVQKTTIDAGFSCPNRDGTVGRGGCTYCNNDAFNPSYNMPCKSVRQQIEEGKEFHINRYRRSDQYLAYFQAYSNTHKPLADLKQIYEEALAVENVVGLVIGTRPDCIDEEKLEYFEELSQKHYIIIEYGLESVYDKTLNRINRCHSHQQSVDAILLTKSFGLKTGAHIMFGLPDESREEMLAEAQILSALPLDTIKFHQLQIIKGTAMAKEYLEFADRFQLFELEEYVEFIVKFIEQLNPNFVIERFAGEVPPRFLVSEPWKIRNDQILQKIEKKLEEKDSWQGKYWK